jgi:AcrR family transcriptional regulator
MVRYKEKASYNTEEKILEAAKHEFMRFGIEGTSIQQIADAAQINKSLVHYYFRTKEKLFKRIFIEAFSSFIIHIEEIISRSISFQEKIENIVDSYIDLLKNNSFLPGFIIHEINRNPDRLYELIQHANIKPQKIFNQIQAEIEKGNIRKVDPRHFFVNVLALCIFPFVAKPLLQRILFNNDEKGYKKFIDERKKEITEFIIQSIKN